MDIITFWCTFTRSGRRFNIFTFLCVEFFLDLRVIFCPFGPDNQNLRNLWLDERVLTTLSIVGTPAIKVKMLGFVVGDPVR